MVLLPRYLRRLETHLSAAHGVIPACSAKVLPNCGISVYLAVIGYRKLSWGATIGRSRTGSRHARTRGAPRTGRWVSSSHCPPWPSCPPPDGIVPPCSSAVASKEAAGGQRDRHIRAVAKKGRMAWRGLVPIVAEAAAVMPARRATVVPSRALMPNWRRRRGGARCGGRYRHGDEAPDDMPAHIPIAASTGLGRTGASSCCT